MYRAPTGKGGRPPYREKEHSQEWLCHTEGNSCAKREMWNNLPGTASCGFLRYLPGARKLSRERYQWGKRRHKDELRYVQRSPPNAASGAQADA
jgi:hypothetical protein